MKGRELPVYKISFCEECCNRKWGVCVCVYVYRYVHQYRLVGKLWFSTIFLSSYLLHALYITSNIKAVLKNWWKVEKYNLIYWSLATKFLPVRNFKFQNIRIGMIKVEILNSERFNDLEKKIFLHRQVG